MSRGIINGVKPFKGDVILYITDKTGKNHSTVCITIKEPTWIPYEGDEIEDSGKGITIYSGDIPFPYSQIGKSSMIEQLW